MVYFFLAASAALFFLGIRVFGIVPRVKGVIAATHVATTVMRSRDMSEEEKESAIQKAALEMIGSFLSILVRTALIVAISIAVVALGSETALFSMQDAIHAASNWTFIVVSTLLMIGAFLVFK